MTDPRRSRGYRNRNPGNIEYNPANRWQGQVGVEAVPPGAKARFAVFESHEYGIRALAALLTTYQDRHGLRTVRGIIARWAPASENATAAYIGRVCKMMDRAADDRLDLHTYADLAPLVRAIITHELGGQPYDQAVIDEGLRRAGVVRPVATMTEAAGTGTGRGAINVAAAASAAAAGAPAITALGGLPQWTGVALVVAAAVLAAVWIIAHRRRAA